MPSEKRFKLLALFAVALAAAACEWPILGLPAFLAVLLTFIVVEGRLRWLVGGLGGTLAMLAFTRFLLVYAVPNIIIAGQIAAEERAVDHLRELRWAAVKASSKSGAQLSDLVGPYLDPGVYKPTASPEVYRFDSYFLTLNTLQGGALFTAYAWPVGEKRGGQRVFATNESDAICELSDAGAFVGLMHVPPVEAAFSGDPNSPCRPPWHPWKHKKVKPQ